MQAKGSKRSGHVCAHDPALLKECGLLQVGTHRCLLSAAGRDSQMFLVGLDSQCLKEFLQESQTKN